MQTSPNNGTSNARVASAVTWHARITWYRRHYFVIDHSPSPRLRTSLYETMWRTQLYSMMPGLRRMPQMTHLYLQHVQWPPIFERRPQDILYMRFSGSLEHSADELSLSLDAGPYLIGTKLNKAQTTNFQFVIRQASSISSFKPRLETQHPSPIQCDKSSNKSPHLAHPFPEVSFGGLGGSRPPKEKEKKKERKKKETRERKEKKRKKGTMNSVKLLHIKCCFFQFFNSPVALKNKKNFGPPRKSWNDAPALSPQRMDRYNLYSYAKC